MTYRFQCPNGHVLKAEPNMAGMRMRCPACQVAVEVPLRPENAGEEGERPPGVKSTFVRPKKRPGAPPVAELAEDSDVEIRRKSPPPLPKKKGSDKRWREEPRPGEAPPVEKPEAKKAVPPRPPSSKAGEEATAIPPEATADHSEIEAPPVADEPSRPRLFKQQRGYYADGERRQTVYWLAAALVLVAVIGFLPARQHYALMSAPTWAVVLWMITALQVAYIVYLVSIPDWSTTWVAMLVFAGIAAIYGFTLALAIWTAGSEELRFGLEPIRANVARWCGGMLLLSFLAAFMCGRISHMWHKRYRYV